MITSIIKTSDLIHINDASKSIKCRNVMWIDNKIISIDNFNYIKFTILNPDKISVFPKEGYIINQRELSAFIKTITTESQFSIDERNIDIPLYTISGEFHIRKDKYIETIIINKLVQASILDNDMVNIPEVNMSEKLQQLYKLSKTSGSILYKYDENHLMTLFAGVVPLNKSDKLFLKICDNSESTFIARFRAEKKSFNVFVYLLYLKL